MFLKQTTFKPRSGSQSSQSGQAENKSASPPPKAETPPRKSTDKSTDMQSGAISAAAAGRRRSSAGQAYAGLNQYKRSSQDASATERKAAWTEQKSGGGILGGMWNSFTKGS